MKFMIVWRIAPGAYQTSVENFLSTGAPAPSGLRSVGRWHVPGSARGWHLVEGDPQAVAHHVAEWANLVELEVSPVIEDAEAAAGLSKVYGS